jgi:hypothetical protein
MFKAIISRDNGTPWPDINMTTQKWLAVAPTPVHIPDLIATQPGLMLHALTGRATTHCGDPIPHVISWQGSLYLEDGHHRAARHLLAGNTTMTARVLAVD